MGALCVNLRPLSVTMRPNFVNLRPSLVLTLLPDHSFHFQPTDFAFKPLHLCHTKEAVSRTGGSPVQCLLKAADDTYSTPMATEGLRYHYAWSFAL
jgi:hypothetical protein